MPEFFIVPEPPPLARLGSIFFVLIVKKDAPFTVQDMSSAVGEHKPWRLLMGKFFYHHQAGRSPFRQVGSLPNTVEMAERAVMFPILRDPEERQLFFDEFARWLATRRRA
jgi:hypothetical protein